MRLQSKLAAAALLATCCIGTAGEVDTLGDVKANCQEEWPGDYSMQEYCIDSQLKALNQLIEIKNRLKVDEEKAILARCVLDWVKARGADWTMVHYCFQQQHASYRRLKGG